MTKAPEKGSARSSSIASAAALIYNAERAGFSSSCGFRINRSRSAPATAAVSTRCRSVNPRAGEILGARLTLVERDIRRTPAEGAQALCTRKRQKKKRKTKGPARTNGLNSHQAGVRARGGGCGRRRLGPLASRSVSSPSNSRYSQ